MEDVIGFPVEVIFLVCCLACVLQARCFGSRVSGCSRPRLFRVGSQVRSQRGWKTSLVFPLKSFFLFVVLLVYCKQDALLVGSRVVFVRGFSVLAHKLGVNEVVGTSGLVTCQRDMIVVPNSL